MRFLLLLVLPYSIFAQTVNLQLLKNTWQAKWISVPGSPPREYGVYHFRKSFSLVSKPDSFIVQVTADNRFRLFVNGKWVAQGPARGDLSYWNFESIDLAPYLKAGSNTIAALVWNEGDYRPEGQISHRTGFLLQGNSKPEEIVNTNSSWRCIADQGYQPLPGIGYGAYYVAGPGEHINFNRAVSSDWVSGSFKDESWQAAQPIGWSGGQPKGLGDINNWMLVPSSLPLMEIKTQRLAVVRRATGVQIPVGFPGEEKNVIIAPHSRALLLLDQSFLTNAYLNLKFSKGRNAGIQLQYAEALYSSKPAAYGPGAKDNRNEIDGKKIAGRRDSLVSNGEEHQLFTSLNYRTFRYLQIEVQTQEEALVLEDIYGSFTGYPFQLKANLLSVDPFLQKVLETGWRTARACAMDTYMDCPYYEQLQYVGDTRIQALVSIYNSGDDRLVRNALDQMDHSRMAEGITLSRHPSFSPQQIPTFSLWYIGMLYDYWMYRGGKNYVKDKLQGVRNILWFFSKYQQPDGSLRNVPYWNFTDWVDGKPGWGNGVAPLGKSGSSSVQDLQLLWAYQLAAELELQLGTMENSDLYAKKATQLKQTILKKYWNKEKGLLADTEEQDLYSQHANSLLILTQTVQNTAMKQVADKLLKDQSLAPASIYFKYYLHRALIRAGKGNDYLSWLGKWKENLDLGMTTWAEMSDIAGSRSDCHAWGASPNIEIYRTLLGIDSDAPGFSKLKIAPHLGNMTNIGGSIPHPQGEISVHYQKKGSQWDVSVQIPPTLTGTLEWEDRQLNLTGGKNHFVFTESK